MSDTERRETEPVSPSPPAPELVWAVVTQQWDDKRRLVVLPRETFEHWMERVPVLHCSTWGELRETVSIEVYLEVCGLCGYGSFEEYTRHLEITGTAPLPGAAEVAAASYDPDAEAPGDDAGFEAQRDIGACADGDWPPSVAWLMNEELPAEIVETYATVGMTVFNGAQAEIPARHRKAVLRDLEALGYRLVEEPGLGDLVNCFF